MSFTDVLSTCSSVYLYANTLEGDQDGAVKNYLPMIFPHIKYITIKVSLHLRFCPQLEKLEILKATMISYIHVRIISIFPNYRHISF